MKVSASRFNLRRMGGQNMKMEVSVSLFNLRRMHRRKMKRKEIQKDMIEFDQKSIRKIGKMVSLNILRSRKKLRN